MGRDLPTAWELRRLADELRHAVPSFAPMTIAESAQHSIVKLEYYAAQDPIPDDARNAYAVAQSVLRTCASIGMLPAKTKST